MWCSKAIETLQCFQMGVETRSSRTSDCVDPSRTSLFDQEIAAVPDVYFPGCRLAAAQPLMLLTPQHSHNI